MKKRSTLAAIIYIEPNIIRLLIGQRAGKQKIKIVENMWLPIVIGAEIYSKKTVSEDAVAELIDCLKNFKQIIHSYNISNVKTLVGQFLKEANNSDIIFERIYNAVGIDFEFLESPIETDLLLFSQREWLFNASEFIQKNNLIIVSSADSIRLLFQVKGKLVFFETFNLGYFRIEKHAELHWDSFKLYLRNLSVSLISILRNTISEKAIVQNFILINDNVVNFVNNLKINKIIKNAYTAFSRKIFSEITNDFIKLNFEQLKKKYNIVDGHALTTVTALLIAANIYELTAPKKIIIPKITISGAMLYYNLLKDKNSIILEHTEILYQNVISSAFMIARKFNSHYEHISQVRKLCVQLFKKMQETYQFEEKELLYLEAAAILHDIGKYINFKNHHRHSESLLEASEIIGLNRAEMRIIGLISRYHRKNTPKESHNNYNLLNLKERNTVSRLAAILKICDALDSLFPVQAQTVEFNLIDNALEITVKLANAGADFFDLLKINLNNKGDYFEKFFGLELILNKPINTN